MHRSAQFCVLAGLLILLGGLLQPVWADPPRSQPGPALTEPSEETLQQWWQSLPKDRPLRQKYEHFRDLPEEKQLKLRRRWQKYQAMTPEQRELARQRYQNWQSLSPEERQKLRKTYRQFKDLPAQQREELRRELHLLKNLPADEQERRRKELRQRYFHQGPAHDTGADY